MDDWEKESELTHVAPVFDIILGGSAKTIGRCPASVRLEGFSSCDLTGKFAGGMYEIFDVLSGQVPASQLAKLPAISSSDALNRFVYSLQYAAASQFKGRAQDAEAAAMLEIWHRELPTPDELGWPEWSDFFDSAQPRGPVAAAQLLIAERNNLYFVASGMTLKRMFETIYRRALENEDEEPVITVCLRRAPQPQPQPLARQPSSADAGAARGRGRPLAQERRIQIELYTGTSQTGPEGSVRFKRTAVKPVTKIVEWDTIMVRATVSRLLRFLLLTGRGLLTGRRGRG